MGPSQGIAVQRALPVFAGVVAVTIGIAVFDLALVSFARNRKAETSRVLFERGRELAAADRHAEALELLRAAHNEAPANSEYHLAYVRTVQQLGRADDARSSLEALLQREPASGPANVEMARLLARNGEAREAAWFYHRGLYGEWRGAPDLTAVRLELADLLAKSGARRELLSELLLLGPALEEKPELRVEFGRLLLAAENWDRAKEVFRSLVRATPANPDLWAYLAEAQLGNGEYQSARASWQRALDLRPGETRFEAQLKTVAEAIELDPSRRRLSAAERHRRSHALLIALIDALRACTPSDQSVAAAAAALGAADHGRRPAEAAESDLDTLERLWMARDATCAEALQLPEPARIAITRVVH